MKDYSNYYSSYKDKMKNDGEILFNVHTRGFEGFDVLIDDISYKVIIQQTTNPLDEYKEDRKLICLQDVLINKGSNIFYDNKNWLVVTDIDFNGITKDCKIRECNNILKFYNSFSKLIQIPCIAENNLGLVNENSTMSTGDAKLTITMSNNNLTQDIKRNKRLICDGTAWHITNISKLKTGLIELTCEEIESQDGDDLVNEIPMNDEYLPINILLNSNYSVNLGLTLKLNPVIKQGDNIIDLPLVFTSDNTDVITVDNLGNITTVGIGTANITCSLADNEDIKVTISIEVVNEVVVDNFTYDITSSNGEDFIKKTTTITYNAIKYNNLVEVPNTLFDFTIVNYNGLSTSSITVTIVDGSTIKIKNNTDVGNIVLRATERNTSNYVEKTIELKNIYGN